mmetsp:Transcript_32613/g.29480  ORF Transcript_32613/g.29480 Transcript_32613/m.29480 type:complete len:463 (-) Transcript_32613:107-1495(-)
MVTKGSIRDSYMGISPAFHQKEKTLRDINMKAQSGILANDYTTVLKSNTLDLFRKFSGASLEKQRGLLQDNDVGLLSGLCEMIEKCSQDKVLMLFVIPSIDGILFDDRKNVKILVKIFTNEPKEPNVLTRFLNILNTPNYDPTVYEAAARVASVILSELPNKQYFIQQENFINQLISFAGSENGKVGDHCVMTCLVNILRQPVLVKHFLNSNGMHVIGDVLKNDSNVSDIQTVYYTFCALWLLSYEKASFKAFQDAVVAIIRLMIHALQSLSREKIIRVGYACFRNLSVDEGCLEVMIDNGLLKVTDTVLKGVIKDKDTVDDIEYVGQILEKNLKILTSYEKYVKEVNSLVLEWGPIHCERFWRENVRKFEENDFYVIRKLIMLLDESNPEVKQQNQAIACYDLGEFCRFHPFGKNVLDKLDAKLAIMKLIDNNDAQVKENALLAIQKIMIHSWQAAGTDKK